MIDRGKFPTPVFSIDPACANLIFGGERHVELLLLPRLRLRVVARAARRVAQPRVGACLDGAVLQGLSDAQHVVVEGDGLLERTLVVV